jgi:hypothetical protein
MDGSARAAPPGSPRGGGIEDEAVRAARLLDAQAKAEELFAAIQARGLIAAGVREISASNAIRDLAADMFGVDRYWHKRIVRAGPNTLQPYKENPPDRAIAADDIVFCDFGPIFEAWEADFGRTYVLGDDPDKLRLRDTLPVVFEAGRRFFDSSPEITGEQLFAHMVGLAQAAGWTFGGTIAGHLVGQFPHEKIKGAEIFSYIAPGNDRPMRRLDRNGQVCHWILEVHLTDPPQRIGGFFEELLDLGPGGISSDRARLAGDPPARRRAGRGPPQARSPRRRSPPWRSGRAYAPGRARRGRCSRRPPGRRAGRPAVLLRPPRAPGSRSLFPA